MGKTRDLFKKIRDTKGTFHTKMGWVTSKANEQEDYINYFGNGMGISRNWATTYFLTFDGQPQNCRGTHWYVI